MVPAGAPTEESVEALKSLLESGDAIIDGGNSYFKDDIRRSRALKENGIHYLDAGTSGGVWGNDPGDGFIIVGDAETGERRRPNIFTPSPRQKKNLPWPGAGDINKHCVQGEFFCVSSCVA